MEYKKTKKGLPPIACAKKKKRRPWAIALECLVVLTIVISIAVCVNVFYLDLTYDLPFFVNGMSMYPTLNADGTDSHGKKLSWYSGECYAGYTVDYGYAKSVNKGDWKGHLNRYDIVVTYYPTDYVKTSTGDYKRDAEGKLVLRNNASIKIKRVVGLPNEVVTLDYTGNVNRVWGELTVDGQHVDALYDESDFPSGGYTYNYPVGSHTWELGADEYVILGDNRGRSSDCYDGARSFAVLEEMIVGKAYLVIGKRTLDESLQPKSDWLYMFTPWLYRRLC